MRPKLRQALIIAGFSLLGVMALAGWTRNPDSPAATVQPAAFAGEYQRTLDNCVESVPAQSAVYAAPSDRMGYRTYSRPRVVRTYSEQERENVVRRKKRSTGKSVAIVAGSAGAGAAIGAIAGGGKGAAIGGLSGGAAGFVYDRLTHSR
jgi:hypothetical protein